MQAKEWSEYLMLKKKKQVRMLYPAKLSFKGEDEGRIKTFSDK